MSSLNQDNRKILAFLESIVPNVEFRPGSAFQWSPSTSVVTYKPTSEADCQATWSLLHEAAHAKLNHQNYTSDFELLTMEVSAWVEAQSLAARLGIHIDENYIQDCLDTYRDWLHKRGTCPTCGTVGLQSSRSEYTCHNCNQPWLVTASRFCRPYRRKSKNLSVKSRTVHATFR